MRPGVPTSSLGQTRKWRGEVDAIVQDKTAAEKLAGIETVLLPLDQATPEAHRA